MPLPNRLLWFKTKVWTKRDLKGQSAEAHFGKSPGITRDVVCTYGYSSRSNSRSNYRRSTMSHPRDDIITRSSPPNPHSFSMSRFSPRQEGEFRQAASCLRVNALLLKRGMSSAPENNIYMDITYTQGNEGSNKNKVCEVRVTCSVSMLCLSRGINSERSLDPHIWTTQKRRYGQFGRKAVISRQTKSSYSSWRVVNSICIR